MDDTLTTLLNADRLTEVVDIGANPIDGDPPYKSMLEQGLCRVTGFEPQVEALAELERRKGPNERYLPYAVGDGQTHTLRLCRASGMSSLLQPDMESLALFDALKPLAEVTQRLSLDTHRLDDITEVSHCDWLKIDIQGSELSVFQSGRSTLQNAVVIQTEVSFVALYKLGRDRHRAAAARICSSLLCRGKKMADCTGCD